MLGASWVIPNIILVDAFNEHKYIIVSSAILLFALNFCLSNVSSAILFVLNLCLSKSKTIT